MSAKMSGTVQGEETREERGAWGREEEARKIRENNSIMEMSD
jgi:hypothetical protein